jgi:hypothetical protein
MSSHALTMLQQQTKSTGTPPSSLSSEGLARPSATPPGFHTLQHFIASLMLLKRGLPLLCRTVRSVILVGSFPMSAAAPQVPRVYSNVSIASMASALSDDFDNFDDDFDHFKMD